MYDSIIIGCGAAGMTAALNILRNGKTVLIIEKESIGGQIAKSPLVENYPTIKAISGSDLSNELFEQVLSLGAKVEFDEVLSINKVDNKFIIKTSYNEFESLTCVLAVGAEHNTISAKGIEKDGVSYCALCDGAFYKDENVIVIGDANTALQYGVLMSSIASHVDFCMLFDHYYGEKVLIDKLESKTNITIHKCLSLKEVLGESKVEGAVFENTETHEDVKIDAKAIFVAIGQSPRTDIYSEFVDRNKSYIITNDRMETKTDGLYAIGDCRNKEVRQLTTAMNDGAICAYFITRYLG